MSFFTRKKTIFLTFFVACCLSNLSCFANTLSEKLYVIHSDKTQITRNACGQLRLDLQPTNQYVVFFSDRPKRATGIKAIADFLQMWNEKNKNSFKNDPPNASLSGLINRMPYTSFISLSEPTYDATSNTLSFHLNHIAGKAPASASLEEASLFIE